ncbi:substrate-binding domain-containing protein [Nocardia sp. R6R-6]|uniref:substrate-binding domain-containing protein n=1 Tax=Nocardia sp. R6R-6 TaxID=3459303 RepID=UPI00403DDBA2
MNPIGSLEELKLQQAMFEKVATSLGGSVKALDAGGDPDRQVSQFELLLNQHVDAIVVPNPLNADALEPMLRRARSQGIPVIGQDAVIDFKDGIGLWTTQLAGAADLEAWSAGLAMAQQNPGGKVAIIGAPVPVPLLKHRVERLRYWAEKCGLNVVGSATADKLAGDAGSALQPANGLLLKYADLAGILTYNGGTAAGAKIAARSLGRDIDVIGAAGDAATVEAIANGQLLAGSGSILKSSTTQLVWAAYAAAAGDKVPAVVAATPAIYVMTSKNAKDYPSLQQQLDAM